MLIGKKSKNVFFHSILHMQQYIFPISRGQWIPLQIKCLFFQPVFNFPVIYEVLIPCMLHCKKLISTGRSQFPNKSYQPIFNVIHLQLVTISIYRFSRLQYLTIHHTCLVLPNKQDYFPLEPTWFQRRCGHNGPRHMEFSK